MAAATTALFLIGTSAPVASGLDDYPLLAGQAIRFALSAAALLGLRLCIRRRAMTWRRRDLVSMLVLGTIGLGGFSGLVVASTREADPAVVGTVLAGAPIALAVLGPAMRRQRASRRVVTGSVLVASGTATAAGLGSSSLLGVILCLAALACEILFSLLAVPLIARYGTLATTTYAVTVAALTYAVLSICTSDPAALQEPTPSEIASLCYLALIISVAANLSWYLALPLIGAARAGLFYAFTPVGAIIAELILHGSSPSSIELCGLALITSGLIAGMRRPNRSHACPGAHPDSRRTRP